MPLRTRTAVLTLLLLVLVAGAVTIGVLVRPSQSPAEPDPAPDPAPAVARQAEGEYRVVFDTGEERTWELVPGCEQPREAPCLKVIGNGRAEFEAVYGADGRWSYELPYPINLTCSGPPISIDTWSWDDETLTGTVVHHIAAGCGLPERDEQYLTFTLTRT